MKIRKCTPVLNLSSQSPSNLTGCNAWVMAKVEQEVTKLVPEQMHLLEEVKAALGCTRLSAWLAEAHKIMSIGMSVAARDIQKQIYGEGSSNED